MAYEVPDIHEAIEHFKQAALINIEQSNRDGNTIVLGDRGKVIISGDLHGHRRNFERMVKLAKLESSPDHHLILHEIIHGGPTNPNGHDLSHTLLLRQEVMTKDTQPALSRTINGIRALAANEEMCIFWRRC